MLSRYIGDWRWLTIRGVAAILFGVATLVWPTVTLWALVVMFGVFVLVDGLFTLAASITGDIPVDRGWWGFYGLVGIATGVVAFVWPSITALALLYVIAIWAFVIGFVEVAIAIRHRHEIQHEWALGVAGVLSVVLGVLLVADPGDGALAITWAIGWFATLVGLAELMLAWDMYHLTHGPRSHVTAHRGTPHPVV